MFVDEVDSCGTQVIVLNVSYHSSTNLSCSVSARSKDGIGQSSTVHIVNGSCKSKEKLNTSFCVLVIVMTYLAVVAPPLSVLRQLFSPSLHAALPSVEGLELVPLSNTSLLVSWQQPQVAPELIIAYAVSWSSSSTNTVSKLVSIDAAEFSRRHTVVYDLCT